MADKQRNGGPGHHDQAALVRTPQRGGDQPRRHAGRLDPYLPKLRQWLVDGGTTFRNGYVSTPSCCPSRAGLMSGRYVDNNGQFQQQTLGFNLNLTVQRYLHDAGYLTGHAGKFLHWLDLSVEAPHFDRWTHFKGGHEDVFMNFDGTAPLSQALRAARQCAGASCP